MEGLFPHLFQEWQAASAEANDAWADVWCKLDALAAGESRGPSTAEVVDAVRLRLAEGEWLRALNAHLRAMRDELPII